jgi:GH15 family glucan-1,4-alpha-glucosidase
VADPDAYRPIGDYALIGDCHAGALVSRDGSIDRCCMPRFDSASVFGRLLDAQRGGSCSIRPQDGDVAVSRRYVGDSLVLETTFRRSSGEARLVDCFTTRAGGGRDPYRQLLRTVEGVRGWLPFELLVAARFDYGEVQPWLRRRGVGLYSAIGGNDGLVISCDADLERVDEHDLRAAFRVRAGQRVHLSITYVHPEEIDPALPGPPPPAELDRRLEDTIAWWQRWAERIQLDSQDAPAARRSAIVLKGLQNAPTGAIVAAPTTSLPETPDGSRNWDYRATWVRDSAFTVRSLAALGADAEADGFRRFVERSAAGSTETLQIAYGPGGERRLTEITLDLEGYQGARPVRIGNAAAKQTQLDVYGELLDLSWRWHRRGSSPDDDYWRFLLELVDAAAERWQEPDRGIWELRGEPRQLVHAKVLCWVALDRGLKLADECLRRAPTRRWTKVRDEIREAVEHDGYDKGRGVFVQSFGSDALDAALLLLPSVDFVAYDDERMLRTAEAIRTDLDDGHGLILRYRGDESLAGQEGAFITCSFWLAECLAHQGRVQDARELFDRVSACGSDLGLLPEEYDSRTGELRGNYPQGLSHLSHIAAAVALAQPYGPGASTALHQLGAGQHQQEPA